MFCYDYKCRKCRFYVGTAVGLIGYYLLANGSKLHTLTSPAWCDYCQTVTNAERLSSVEELSNALTRYCDGVLDEYDIETAELLNTSTETFAADRINSITERLAFLSGRDTPACCIECGTHSFHFLTDQTDDGSMPSSFVHPHCGGELELVRTCHASPSTYFMLDQKGTRIDAHTTQGGG